MVAFCEDCSDATKMVVNLGNLHGEKKKTGE